jgi:hypothetical protein
MEEEQTMTMIEAGTEARTVVSRRCRIVFAAASTDAFSDAWHDAADDVENGMGGVNVPGRIVANIGRNLAERGYSAGSPCIDDYTLAYREEYQAALEYERDARAMAEGRAALFEAEDRRPQRKSPESEADNDANCDACYALHCQAHGHSGGPRPHVHEPRHNPEGDEEFTRRYMARYDERYSYWLGVWRARNAAKAAA